MNMKTSKTTFILGIPIPSSSSVFLAIVGIHVLFGVAAVVVGAITMLSAKGRGRHSNFGTIYFWSLFGVLVTMSVLSFMRWAENYHLFILGVLSFGSAYFGRAAARRGWRQWPRVHLTCMGVSYVVMLTAFYVDNGRNLPLWRELPQIAFWILPGVIGLPLILYAVLRHPFVPGVRSLAGRHQAITDLQTDPRPRIFHERPLFVRVDGVAQAVAEKEKASTVTITGTMGRSSHG